MLFIVYLIFFIWFRYLERRKKSLGFFDFWGFWDLHRMAFLVEKNFFFYWTLFYWVEKWCEIKLAYKNINLMIIAFCFQVVLVLGNNSSNTLTYKLIFQFLVRPWGHKPLSLSHLQLLRKGFFLRCDFVEIIVWTWIRWIWYSSSSSPFCLNAVIFLIFII